MGEKGCGGLLWLQVEGQFYVLGVVGLEGGVFLLVCGRFFSKYQLPVANSKAMMKGARRPVQRRANWARNKGNNSKAAKISRWGNQPRAA